MRIAFLLLVGSAIAMSDAQAADTRPRLLITTDIGGDPDDQQSLVRLLTYANEFEIEGLIASASGTPGELKKKVVQPQLIRRVVEAYGAVRDNLSKHAPGYPTAAHLLDRVKAGNPDRGVNALGAEHDTEASQWIIRVVDRPDPRPVCIAIWGGQTDLAQALWRVRNDRSPEELKSFLAKIRVYDIADQDGLQTWIFQNFPDLFYILAAAEPGRDKRTGAFRGMYLGGDETLTSQAWLESHVRQGHGPLGALYPNQTWTAPNPHSALKEGDTPSWLYFLPNGLHDPAHPEWGGWGGRFRPVGQGLFRDALDTVGDTSDARTTVWRWRPAFQAGFQARLDWCVQSTSEANHPPNAVFADDATRGIVHRNAQAGGELALNASGSTDPDGDALSYRWWIYPEAGSYQGRIEVPRATAPKTILHLPGDSAAKTVHVILEVTDNGRPALTSYRRVVVSIAGP